MSGGDHVGVWRCGQGQNSGFDNTWSQAEVEGPAKETEGTPSEFGERSEE